MKISLAEHFSYSKLIRFTLPSIAMMVFTSIYSVVDGFFVSNFAGKAEFTAVNFIMPLIMILSAVGFMLGTGGSALVAKRLGEGNESGARSLFSLIVYVTAGLGVVIGTVGFFVVGPIAEMLGAKGEMLELCIIYARIILAALPFFMLQIAFQAFMIVAERPNLGFIFTVIAGVGNIVLDALLVAVLDLGLVGAALATALSQGIGGILPVIYFIFVRGGALRLGGTVFEGRALGKVCTNGSSELMSNIAMSLSGMLFNYQLLKYAGENGIAAYGVLMYVNFFFVSVFIGFSVGSAPIISYNYGAGNKAELRGLLRRSCTVVACFSVAMLALALLLCAPLSSLFVGYDPELYKLTVRGFLFASFSFLFCGFGINLSSFFTALNDGITSAFISFLRTLILQVVFIFLLPIFFGIDGIWLSIVCSEVCAALIAFGFLISKRKKYGYM